jgi:hypothetical protein
MSRKRKMERHNPELVKRASDNSFALGKKEGLSEVVKELKNHYIFGTSITQLLEVDEKWQFKLREWGIK